MGRKLAWTLVASGTALALGYLGERALRGGWRLTTGAEPPEDAESDDVGWAHALAWTAVSAAVVALARAAARRSAAAGWESVTGSPPPDA